MQKTEHAVLAIVWVVAAPWLVLLPAAWVLVYMLGSTGYWELIQDGALGFLFLYAAAVTGALLRWRRPFGGGNSAGTILLFMAAMIGLLLVALAGEGPERIGQSITGAVLALPGAIVANLILVSWGRSYGASMGLTPKDLGMA